MAFASVASRDGNVLGFLAGLGAFLIWGFLVLFWSMLDAVPPLEILCYRIVFSFVTLLPVVLLTGRWDEIAAAARNRKIALIMFASSCTVGCNWFLYIWAVSTGQILETSLGYYINPLVNVLIGFLFLHERPTRLQGVAIGVAAAGVLWSFWGQNGFPWLGLPLCALRLHPQDGFRGGPARAFYGNGGAYALGPRLYSVALRAWRGLFAPAEAVGRVSAFRLWDGHVPADGPFRLRRPPYEADDTGPLAVYFSYLRLLPRHFRLPSGAESLRAVYLCVHLAGASSLYL